MGPNDPKIPYWALLGSAAWAKPLNPPPPVEGGTGVCLMVSRKRVLQILILRGARLSGGAAHAADP